MSFRQKKFQENELTIKDKKLKYYLSPVFVKNNFKHAFFTKKSSEINLSILPDFFNIENKNCLLNQIHSNKIVFGSNTLGKKRLEADGIFCDKHNQNLWIYTADCMPILFADKKTRCIAAIHCGRKGLEKKIIHNLIQIFQSKGCSKENIIVAIGPSISKKNYQIDKKTLRYFYKQYSSENSESCSDDKGISTLKKLVEFDNKDLIPLNLKKYAYIQLLNQNIPNKNIDISNLCTYESNHDFYSWRRSKTFLRQWTFISP